MDAFAFLGDVAQQIPLKAPRLARHNGLDGDFHTTSMTPTIAFESQGDLNFSVCAHAPDGTVIAVWSRAMLTRLRWRALTLML